MNFDIKVIMGTFALVFVAELGDKTQLATLCRAGSCSPLSVFIGSAAALVLTSLLAAVLGGLLQQNESLKPWITRVAAAAFIVMGVTMLVRK